MLRINVCACCVFSWEIKAKKKQPNNSGWVEGEEGEGGARRWRTVRRFVERGDVMLVVRDVLSHMVSVSVGRCLA